MPTMNKRALPTAAKRRRLHEEWVERVVLPALGGLTGPQRDLARKLFFRKRDIRLVGSRPRPWDLDRRLALLTDYDLLLSHGFRSAEAHRLLQDLHGTSRIPAYLREARKLFPKNRKKRR
jgi:hypothetical protein